MSVWTHAVGSLRVSGGWGQYGNNPSLGPTCDYHSPEEQWDAVDKAGTPRGSEGSIQWKWNPKAEGDSSVIAGVFTICGDLRDYDDPVAIYNWLKDRIENMRGYHIRDCSLKVSCERGETILIYDAETEDFKTELTYKVIDKV